MPPARSRRWFRIVVGNAGLLVLLGGVGEVWLRLTMPFAENESALRFVPGVGFLYEPGSTVRSTNRRDFWNVSPANRLGFLDREPIPPARAAASCHITVIGDSFVEAKQVPIPEKFHLVLETLAAAEPSPLPLTTSAFGREGTGQVQQLALYDRYARRREPDLVVLVFYVNDFWDNSTLLMAARYGVAPERAPWNTVVRDESGTLRLRPPQPPLTGIRPYRVRGALHRVTRALRWQADWSYLVARLGDGLDLVRIRMDTSLRARASAADPSGFASIPRRTLQVLQDPGADPESLAEIPYPVLKTVLQEAQAGGKPLPTVLQDAVELTGFALDQFVSRAERDGAELVLLVTSLTSIHGSREAFEVIHSLATARGIPVLDQYEYLLRQGREPEQARFRFDGHWNRAGHRWAAEAILDHLRSRPGICAGSDTAAPVPEPGS